MVITIMSQGGSYYCMHCQFASEYLCTTMGTFVMDGNLLRIKWNFIWVRLLSPKLDIILKLIEING